MNPSEHDAPNDTLNDAPETTVRSAREITRLVAPCGLFCGGCLAFEGGPIRSHARALAGLLGPNFGVYAQRLSEMNPVLSHYPAFADMLEQVCIKTVEAGHMTKDLALLVSANQPHLTTEQFMDKLIQNLDQAMQKKAA